jgi:hypothetical protein
MKVSTKKYAKRKIKLIHDVHAHGFNVLHIYTSILCTNRNWLEQDYTFISVSMYIIHV